MQDSLQNFQVKRRQVSPKSVSPSAKDDKQRALQQQLKQKFITSLSKLQSSQTREIGLQQIRLTIDRNRQPQNLRMYLAMMKSLKVQGTSSSTKQHEILIFSILAEIFKENLVDPIDKPTPSRIKTCFRIIEILHSYFTDTSGTVQQACARVLIDLGKYVLGAQQQNPSLSTQTFITLLFTPLSSILKSGVDKASQSTASVCINQQIQYWKAHNTVPIYRQMLNQICPQMLTVSLKLNCQYNQIFMALCTLIEIKGLQFFNNRLVQFVSKILGVINKINNSSQYKATDNVSNFNMYMCKVYVCEILQRIGELLRDKPEIKGKLDELDVIPALEKAARNRVIQVQIAASKAMRAWNGEIVSPEHREKRPSSSKGIARTNSNFVSLEEARKNKKKLRSNSKEEKLKLQRQLNHIQQDLNKLVKGGWGPHNRANNFIKKNTGVGGGYCSKMEDSPSPGKTNKSHKQHIEQLRKYIKQSSKQHGKKDKFVFYEDRDNSGSKKAKSQQNFYTNQHAQKQSPMFDKSSPTALHKNNRKNSKKNHASQQDSLQFGLVQDQGDQMVYIPQKQKPSLKGSQQQYRNPYADQNFGANRALKSQGSQSIDKSIMSNLGSDSIAIQDIMTQQQIKQLQQQYEKNLGIQSKPDLSSKISVDRNRQKMNQQVPKFGEMTFNNSNDKGKKDEKKKGLDQVKSIAQQQLGKKNEQKYDQKITQQPKAIQGPRKARKAMDDQIVEQHIVESQPQNWGQPTQMKNTPQPKKQNDIQLHPNNGPRSSDNRPKQTPKQTKRTQQKQFISGSFKPQQKAQTQDPGMRKSTGFQIDQFMNESDFEGLDWNPFKAESDKINQSMQQSLKQKSPAESVAFNKNKQKQMKQSAYKDSLVLSSSRVDQSKSRSHSKSPPKAQSKLNNTQANQPQPQNNSKALNKFNSFSQQNPYDQDQQILDQSKYQQSMPQGQKLLSKPFQKSTQPVQASQPKQNIQDYYKKSVQIGQSIDKQKQKHSRQSKQWNQRSEQQKQFSSQVYQQMIKNPPKTHLPYRFDKPSQLPSSQLSNIKQVQQQPSQQNIENITDLWERVLEHVEQNQFNQAYTLVFQMDDPIYLLRLMLITQTPLRKLTPANTCKLWEKFLQIYQHKFIDNIFVQMFTTANKFNGGKGLSKSLSIEETNDLLLQLYQLSGRTKGKLSFGAATLYNQIDGSINKRE